MFDIIYHIYVYFTTLIVFEKNITVCFHAKIAIQWTESPDSDHTTTHFSWDSTEERKPHCPFHCADVPLSKFGTQIPVKMMMMTIKAMIEK